MTFDLTPKKVRFIISVAISVVLTVIAIVIQYVHITGGAAHGGFEILLVRDQLDSSKQAALEPECGSLNANSNRG